MVVAVVLLAGCGSAPPLPAKSAEVPAGIDLSGQWILSEDNRDTRRAIADAERKAAGAEEELIPKSTGTSKSRRSSDVQVYVFLETGDSLRISQTDHGLFISFDRSVVEEYRFGEQRIVSVGPVEAERVSGWENGAYVIETRGKEGAMLIESYRLDDNDRMIRSIRIVHRERDELNVSQVFERS